MPRCQLPLAFALLLLAATAAGAGVPPSAVLGGDGELFVIEQGTYGEVMARPHAPEAENSVLVLRVKRPDRQDEIFPLPATLGPDIETAAALLYEETADTLFVAWEARTNHIHSQIRMAGFSDGVWGETIAVSDSRFSFKSYPRLAVTRDTFEGRDEDGEPVTMRRAVLHAVWVEDRTEGTAVLYSPVFLVGGRFEGTGPGPIFVLTDLIDPPEEDLLAVPLADLPLVPTVEVGSNDHSVVIGFIHPATGRLITVDLTVLSGDISALADGARSHFIETGAHFDTHDPGELASLASGARSHFIETGVRLEGRGLRSLSSAGRLILDVPGSTVGPSSHQISLRNAAVRRLDGLAAGAEPLLLLSADGADALVAWREGGQLRYQETLGGGWSEVRAITLETFDLQSAIEILEHRIRNR